MRRSMGRNRQRLIWVLSLLVVGSMVCSSIGLIASRSRSRATPTQAPITETTPAVN